MLFFSGLQVLPSCARALCRNSPRPAFLAPPCFPPTGFCGRRRQAASFRCRASGAPFLSLRRACAFSPPDSARQRPRKRMRLSPRLPEFSLFARSYFPFPFDSWRRAAVRARFYPFKRAAAQKVSLRVFSGAPDFFASAVERRARFCARRAGGFFQSADREL